MEPICQDKIESSLRCRTWGSVHEHDGAKKISIKPEQEAFLATFRRFGFADQSSMIRAALDDFINGE